MSSGETQPTVALRGVTKRFGGFIAVDDLDFAVEPGRIAALLGPSGCGKTTTLRLIAGFLEPDEGSVLVRGRDMHGVRPYQRNIGLVFQDYALFPHMTVAQNVAYGLRQRRVPRDEAEARVAAMFRLVRLEGFESRRPASLSGGQQQRVALARALATNPELVLLDEPLSALDAKLRQELRAELKEILAAAGATTIVVTHDQEEAMSLAEHVIVMAQGRILQQAAPATIYRAPSCREVATFIGRSNWFDGAFDAGARAFRSDDGCFSVAAPALSAASYGLCVRPERLVVTIATDDRPDLNRLAGIVVDVAHLGAEIHITIRLPSGRTILAIQPDRAGRLPERGSAVVACFRADDGTLVPV